MTTHSPLPTTIGCSWGWTPADPTTLDPYFEKMAAQGQNFFAASGDSSTWSTSNEAWPADDANVVSVGGTDLTPPARRPVEVGDRVGRLRRRHLARQDRDPLLAEALRRDQLQQQGLDHLSQRPGRLGQRELHLLHLRRPDDLPRQRVRRHQLRRAHVGRLHRAGQPAAGRTTASRPIGFINPTIYAQNVTSSYATDFHDITSGTSGSYSAVTGYDLVTGWGSPNGRHLINALAGWFHNPTRPSPISPHRARFR